MGCMVSVSIGRLVVSLPCSLSKECQNCEIANERIQRQRFGDYVAGSRDSI